MAYKVLDNICQLTPTGFNTKLTDMRDITNTAFGKKILIFLQLEDLLQEDSMKRQHISKSSSKRSFKKGMRTQKKNLMPAPQRGGYRL